MEKWVGDNSLVTIFKDYYTLDFASKKCIDRYLPKLYQQYYNCSNVRIHQWQIVKLT